MKRHLLCPLDFEMGTSLKYDFTHDSPECSLYAERVDGRRAGQSSRTWSRVGVGWAGIRSGATGAGDRLRAGGVSFPWEMGQLFPKT